MWNNSLETKSIVGLELMPIALACVVWGQQRKGSLVVVHCDHQAGVHILSSGYSKNKDLVHLI